MGTDNLDVLTVFVAAAEERSVTRAAVRLGLVRQNLHQGRVAGEALVLPL